MSTEHSITKRAADGSLTVLELKQFLDEFDKAAAVGTANPAPGGYGLKVSARVNFRGGIKSITVTVPGGDEKR